MDGKGMTIEANAPVRMQDIAETVGVSVSTVSRVLGGKGVVSSGLEKKIQHASSELGYHRLRRPPLRAGATQEGRMIHCRTESIAFVTPQRIMNSAVHEESHYHAMLEAVVHAAEQEGYHVIMAPYKECENGQLPLVVEKQKADGIILTGHFSVDWLRQMTNSQPEGPIVVMNSHVLSPPTNSVLVDNGVLMHQAISHLVELGHKRIAYFHAIGKSRPAPDEIADVHVAERLLYYRQAVFAAGLELDDALCMPQVFDKDEHPRAIAKEFHRLMNLENPPTAIIAGLGYASCFLHEAASSGYRVPDDLSLLVTDESTIATAIHPNLTTVGSNHEVGGQLAVELLLDLLARKDNPPPVKTIRYESKLTVRESTGPAKR